ncbi:hypothetical protein [Methylobacterium sp. 22177]|uniref:hypothetical protein n=1 Tax=Methylobacterium sp. 22177 TaxID=3453885 RepID=UPI003F856E7B
MSEVPASLTTNIHKPKGVYTSSIEHFIPQSSCHPKCKNGEGDNYSWKEAYPVLLNPATARVECRAHGTDNPCDFAEIHVTFDNVAKEATVYIKSRSSAMHVRVQGDIL